MNAPAPSLSGAVDPAPLAEAADPRGILAQSQAVAVLDRFDRELIGLVPVKTRIRQIAALLVDEVFPEQPVRQWVLSVPYAHRFLFATRAALMGAVLGMV